MNSNPELFIEAVLLIGGNKGDRESLLSQAKFQLSSQLEVLAESSIYESEAWGPIATAPFLNQVLIVSTDLSPLKLLDFIQQVEIDLGRKRTDHWGDRTMDIDILYFEDEVIDDKRLKVPHPYIGGRNFTLLPLVDILPHKVHPITGLIHREMLSRCPDKGRVWKYTPKL